MATYNITCTPKEGYIAVPRKQDSDEWDNNMQYICIKKKADGELWFVCLRGDRAGEALKLSDIDETQWMVNELDGFDDTVHAYYVDFGGWGEHNKYGPIDLEHLSGLIEEHALRDDEGIEPHIRLEQMSRERFMRESGRWMEAYDKLRKNPLAYMDKFLKRQKEAS